MLDVPDNVTGWVAFLRDQLSVKTNWSQTVSKFHCFMDFTASECLFFTPWGGVGGQEQSTARSLAQFVIVNVVDQYEMCVCVIPIKIQIQLLIFMKLNR